MSLQGLPDLQNPLPTADFTLFYPYEGRGPYTLLPHGMAIATEEGDRLNFSLEFVRGQTPTLPPEPYGLLDCRLVPDYHLEAALTFLRQDHAGATLAPAPFAPEGFVRCQPLADLPAALFLPMPLVWDELGAARLFIRLSTDGANILQQALQKELLAAQAAVEVELIGVSPRLPVQVHFNPAELLAALIALGNDRREVARHTLVNYFLHDPAALALTVEGEYNVVSRKLFAEALTDRVRVRFGHFMPAPRIEAGPHIRLVAPTDIGVGRFQWDLAQPIPAPRPLLLPLNPFTAVQKLIRERGVEAVTRTTIVPPINPGHQRVAVVTNLPANLVGAIDLGITIRVEPKLPYRPQAQVKTLSLLHSTDKLPTADLRFAPNEKPEYEFFPYIILAGAQGLQKLEGQKASASDDMLYVRPGNFPVDFVTIKATPSLLALAEITGSAKRLHNGAILAAPFALTPQQASVTLIFPQNSQDATIEIEARSRSGIGTLHLGPLPAQSMTLDLYAFAESGVQHTPVECVFQTSTNPVVFEFQAEDSTESKTLFFTPSEPKKIFTWTPVSPFKCRYRRRQKALDESAPTAWSAYCSPFEPCQIFV